jgi:hypothetical protein
MHDYYNIIYPEMDKGPKWVCEEVRHLNYLESISPPIIFKGLLTVSISLNQQLATQAKSYFWTKFFLQPSQTIKTLK